jgi:hypothetical protein
VTKSATKTEKPSPIIKFRDNYEVFSGAIDFESEKFELERFDVVQPKWHPETQFEKAWLQFLPQVFTSTHDHKNFCAFMDTDFVHCFRKEDGYLVEKRLFDPLYRHFSLLFISLDWRTIFLVFPENLDDFLSCSGEEKKMFTRLS